MNSQDRLKDKQKEINLNEKVNEIVTFFSFIAFIETL